MKNVEEPKSKFLKVRCSKCHNEQVVFEKAASDVNCLVCGTQLLKSTGGKGNLDARLLEVVK